ncbi:MAG: Uma2 family endonuclease, partial [Gemmataceae bacterium]|nr:Uma2 family endonuclease [Gemmataceae bacterium]
FEVVSDSNTKQELEYDKKDFYEQYGAEEYYIYDPYAGRWKGFIRQGKKLVEVPEMEGWVSPRLGIRFERGRETDPGVYDSEGNPFPAYVRLREALEDAIERVEQERRLREQERQRAEQERQRAEQERRLREQERQRAEQLEQELQRLRQMLQERGLSEE